MKVLSIQMQSTTGQVAANYERAFSLLELSARLYRPEVILLPEAFAAYMAGPDMRQFGEDVPGPNADRFCQYSQRYQAMIMFGLIRKNPRGDGIYNSVVIVDKGQILGIYDKTHLTMNLRPEDRALKNEQEIFLPGDRLGLFDTRFGRIGVLICHDGDYPEVWRCLALEGARAVFHLSETSVDVGAWARLHALWNTTPVFTCNLLKRDQHGAKIGGRSVFADIRGNLLDAAGTAESFLYADVNLDEQDSFRAGGLHPWANYFRVRRPDLYGALTRPKQESL